MKIREIKCTGKSAKNYKEYTGNIFFTINHICPHFLHISAAFSEGKSFQVDFLCFALFNKRKLKTWSTDFLNIPK